MMQTTAEQIYNHVKALPESTAREILDFVEFIEQKSRRIAPVNPSQQPPIQWSDSFLQFTGISDMQRFESDRQHLKPPMEDPFA